MAAILIVANDRLVARQMARTLRQAGHSAVVAPDVRSALLEALGCPDLVLLDLGHDIPGEELLRYLRNQRETARIPVLMIAERTEDAPQFTRLGKESVADSLLKPVSGDQLRQAVETALAGQREQDPDALRLARQGQQELIQRLILEGPDPLVLHVYRRLCADRTRTRGPSPAEALTWAEIAAWAKSEGLLDAEQARVLRRVPRPEQQTAGEGSA